MSQNTVKNLFLQLDTSGLTGLFRINPNPSKAEILGYVTMIGEGLRVSGPHVANFPIELIQGQDVNITLIATELTSSSRIFFYSPDGEQPFRINNKPQPGVLSGNFHQYAVTMHLKADSALQTSDLSFDILLVPAGRTVEDKITFTIDPKLKIDQPPSN